MYRLKLNKHVCSAKNESKHINCERQVLIDNMKHPFLVSLNYSFQTPDRLYFVLNFINGGELFFHLQRERSFSEKRAKLVNHSHIVRVFTLQSSFQARPCKLNTLIIVT
jgi:serine/threonine protein kinase